MSTAAAVMPSPGNVSNPGRACTGAGLISTANDWPRSTWATVHAAPPRAVGAASVTRVGLRGRTRPGRRPPVELNGRIFVSVRSQEVE